MMVLIWVVHCYCVTFEQQAIRVFAYYYSAWICSTFL